MDPEALTAREIAPSPGYDPTRHGASFNVSFTHGAISGGMAFLWVRAMHFRGNVLTRLREDIWAVGSNNEPRRVARFISTGPRFTDVASITAWPLVP